MNTKQMQCPNCHAFKLESASARLWGMALLCFIFGTLLLPFFVGLFLYAYAIIELVRLPSAAGKTICKGCGWEGMFTNLQSNV
jgi:hypothetical protein